MKLFALLFSIDNRNTRKMTIEARSLDSAIRKATKLLEKQNYTSIKLMSYIDLN